MLFCDEEIARIPGGIPGVYLLQALMPAAGAYGPLYAGKSADLRRRLFQHAGTGTTAADLLVVRARRQIYFSAAPVKGAADRGGVEAALIRMFRPPCNRQVPRACLVFPSPPPKPTNEEEI
jgi:hypothetical protein